MHFGQMTNINQVQAFDFFHSDFNDNSNVDVNTDAQNGTWFNQPIAKAKRQNFTMEEDKMILFEIEVSRKKCKLPDFHFVADILDRNVVQVKNRYKVIVTKIEDKWFIGDVVFFLKLIDIFGPDLRLINSIMTWKEYFYLKRKLKQFKNIFHNFPTTMMANSRKDGLTYHPYTDHELISKLATENVYSF